MFNWNGLFLVLLIGVYSVVCQDYFAFPNGTALDYSETVPPNSCKELDDKCDLVTALRNIGESGVTLRILTGDHFVNETVVVTHAIHWLGDEGAAIENPEPGLKAVFELNVDEFSQTIFENLEFKNIRAKYGLYSEVNNVNVLLNNVVVNQPINQPFTRPPDYGMNLFFFLSSQQQTQMIRIVNSTFSGVGVFKCEAQRSSPAQVLEKFVGLEVIGSKISFAMYHPAIVISEFSGIKNIHFRSTSFSACLYAPRGVTVEEVFDSCLDVSALANIVNMTFEQTTFAGSRESAVKVYVFRGSVKHLQVNHFIASNGATKKNGGVFDISATSIEDFVISDSEFHANQAQENGGAINILGFLNEFKVERSTFSRNHAYEYFGGAIHIYSPQRIHGVYFIDNSFVAHTTAVSGGGSLIYISSYKEASKIWFIGNKFEAIPSEPPLRLKGVVEIAAFTVMDIKMTDNSFREFYVEMGLFKIQALRCTSLNFTRNQFERVTASSSGTSFVITCDMGHSILIDDLRVSNTRSTGDSVKEQADNILRFLVDCWKCEFRRFSCINTVECLHLEGTFKDSMIVDSVFSDTYGVVLDTAMSEISELSIVNSMFNLTSYGNAFKGRNFNRLTIENTSFIQNDDTPLFVINSKRISINNCKFAENINFNTFGGGALRFVDIRSINIMDSILNSNKAMEGGCIYVRKTDRHRHSEMKLLRTSLSFCKSTQSGGGMSIQNLDMVRFSHSSISNCSASSRGGAIFAGSGSRIDLNDTKIYYNKAQQGGGIGLSDANADLLTSKISWNVASQSGGALWHDDRSKVVYSSEVFGQNIAEFGFGQQIASVPIEFKIINRPTHISASNPNFEVEFEVLDAYGNPGAQAQFSGPEFKLKFTHHYNVIRTCTNFKEKHKVLLCGLLNNFTTGGDFVLTLELSYLSELNDRGFLEFPLEDIELQPISCSLFRLKSLKRNGLNNECNDDYTLLIILFVGIFMMCFVVCLVVFGIMLLSLCVTRQQKKYLRLKDHEIELLEQHREKLDNLVSRCTLDVSQIRKKRVLWEGTGSGAEIWKAKWRTATVAYKYYNKETVEDREIEAMEREIELYRILSINALPSIVPMHGGIATENTIGIVMAYCKYGSLKNYIEKMNALNQQIPWLTKLQWAVAVAEAMDYIHSHNIIHRDLNANNVLINSSLKAQITDFGVATILQDGEQLTDRVGTGSYMAPEVTNCKPYGKPADVFSFGILMAVLLTQKTSPYGKLFGINLRVAQSVDFRPKIPQRFLEKTHPRAWYVNIMKRCYNEQPEIRPTFKEISEILSLQIKHHKLAIKNFDDEVMLKEMDDMPVKQRSNTII